TYDLCTSTTDSRVDILCISITDGEWIYTSSIRPIHADDEMSHHEGEGSYNETMRAVWINEGNHRFTERSDESRVGSAWTITARANSHIVEEWNRGIGMTVIIQNWILKFGLQHLVHPRKAMCMVLDIV
ncbi:hypothetical protein Taro_007288, partial [Colocasia esculenta]|nr:hypothetical protein [Colocasia esculenta]